MIRTTEEHPAAGAVTAVSESSIHGRGLFAARAVVAGERLVEYLGEKITREESVRRAALRPAGAPIYTVAFDDEHDLDGDLPDNPAKFANHGCVTNAELVRDGDRLRLVAARDIAEGSEILFDYGYGLADGLAHPCACGAPRCVGRIVAEPLRPLLKKHLRRPRALCS